jgi:peptidoglycan/LPS O-acetylase OafA/YrhL
MYYYFFSVSGLFSILSLKYAVQIPRVVKYILASIFIAYFTTSFFHDILSDVAYQLFSVILFSSFICVMSQKGTRILENKQLKYWGKISYGIYMYHAIVMQFVGLIYMKVTLITQLPAVLNILLFNILVLTGTIFLSHLSYQYYESYFLNKKKKFRRLQ